jgi:hypothetical protein
MKSPSFKLCAILTAGLALLATSSAVAGNGGNGNKGGGFGVNFGNAGVRFGGTNGLNNGLNNGGGRNNGGCNNGNNNGGGYNGGNNNCQANGGVYGQAFEPFHSSYICQPGDSFYTVSLKEYGTSGAQLHIARFNNLVVNTALVPGQRLVLPSVSANGQLRPANRPAGIGDTTPVQGLPVTTPTGPTTSNLAQALGTVTSNFASTAKPATTEPALPKVAVGSTLVLDGQTFGEESGVARLRVSGLSLPVEVLEWSTSAVKVRLPKLEVTSNTKADLEVLRSDGSVASTSAIELTPVADTLATTN